ncbi:MAG TPA: amino acid adenylation domain-containing protein, partial [Mycobacteriales bacterium]|nr:amino acid adenylation domain-containing protein [Mycobacteriales bacterium]
MEQLGHHVPLSDVRAAVAELLGAPAGDLTDTEDLTARGLDSIRVMRMASWFRRRGVALTFRELLDRPVLSEWCLLAADRVVPTDPTVEPPPVDPGAVFALTPVQHAYWIGRRDDQVLGGVGCHVYLEFDGTGVDPARLDAAVRELTCRHPMLRARFHDDGGQQVSDRSGWPGLRVHDLSGQPADLVARRLDEIRSSSSHRRLQVRRGEVFDVQLSLLPAGATRVHLNVDLLVADVTSIHLILADLATCYVTPDRPGSQPEYGFAHYLAQRAGGTGAERERARRYWAGRLDDLPDGPRLPLAVRPERISRPHFTRHTHRLTSAGWERFAAGARRHGLTPATALATAYAEVLAAWSEHPRFLLNVPLFDRQQLGPAVAGMVADFTNLTLLAVDLGSELSFSDQARRVQDQLRADVTHAAYSGVEVLRDLARADRTGPGGDQWGQRAPVVFACNIGAEFTDATFRRELGELSWMISQTPQVWLDHQVYEMNGELVLCWDVVAELFPPGLTSAMFAAYTTLVDRLATHEPAWTRPVPDLLPADQRDTRDRANATSAAESGRLLHEAFFLRAAEDPERTALLWGRDGTMSYGALAERALAVAAGLLDSGLCAGEPVAVTLPRGPDQVVAVLAVLAAGGVYVPVGVEEPAPRRRRIASGAGIGRALTSTSGGGPSGWPTTVDVLRIEHARGRAPLPAPVPRAADAPAYVIFTSGSTGEPKGVEVTHRSAVNTVEDINDRFGIGPNDRVLAISALDFDLSVYDIFGLLGTGGAVVLADENARRDPGRAHDLLERHSVTLWNSVPVLLDMLLSTGLPVPASLRLALLSGDWIGLDLPGRLADQSGHRCRLVALGGATEAAIWSNALEVGQVPAGWPSVPYGFPLRNQRYRVADQRGRDCPDWVPGELWIGGTGVATGYRGDPAQTSLRFVEYRGLRWYRTGDRGRYRPGGILEFLGRTDRQVKIRGQRVELGEVEAALRTHPDVGQGAAVAVGEPARRLVAVVTPRPGMPGSPDPADVETVETVDGTVAEAEAHLVETVLARLMSRGAFDRAAGPDVPEWTDTLLRLWSDWLTSRSVLDGAPGDRPGHHATRLDALLDSANGEALRLRVGGTHLEVVLTRLEERLDDLAAMVRGDLDPLTLLDDPVLAPEALADLDPGTAAATAAMGRAIAETAGCGPLRIAELGARSGRAAGQLADALAPAEFEYTLLDASSTLLAAARDRLAGAPHRFGYRAMAEGWVPADLRYRFDVVVARHWLHVHADLATGVGVAAMLLAPGGSLLALERTRFSPLALISAALIDHGVLGRTVPAGEWRRLLVLSGLDRPATSEDRHGLLHLRARRPADAPTPHPDHIRRWVADRLPASMVPEQVLVQPRLPLTANGKVDRATVTRMLSEQDYPVGTERGEPPRGEVECRVAEVWAELLGVERPGRGHDFFALGGDSLLATRMVGRLRGAGLRAELSRLFAFPVLGDFAATLTRGAEPGPLTVTEDLAHRHEPFAPTEVQRAYWLGRHEGIALGGAAAHYYCEFDGPGLDLDRFTEACNRLIARHEMLRAVFDEQGNQRILPEVPRFRIPVTPADSDCGGAGRALDALRATMSHQVRDPSSWPLLDVRAVCYRKCGESRVRLGVSLDNLVLDGLSMMIVFAELSTFYHGLDASLPPVRMSFRDYLIQTVPSGQARESAERYWTGRLADLPGPPRLPLAADPATVRAPRFTRRSGRVEPRRWRAITARARAHGLTPSAVLLACYAEVLGRWSGRGDLTVNVTLFDRRDVHPDVRNVLGDFTSLLLVAYQPVVGESFLAAARRVQEQQGRDLDHRDVSATWVLRELRRNATVGAAAMPVVFTSALGMAGGMSLDLSDWLLPRIWGVSQTPQVWLDNQVYESHGGLCYDWDAAEQVVPADVLDAMFGAYSRLLDWLGAADWSEPVPDLLPSAQLAVRTRANATAGPIPDAPLHQGFFTHAAAHPDATACLWDGGRLSFGALAERALRVAARLRRCGISAADTVAVTLPRGPDQIVAVLGVLAAGAAYVPVGVDQPPMRRDRMYRACGARLVLADSAVTTTAAVVLTPADTARDRPLDAPVLPCPDAPAYVIFTSGSTGEPKGVEVTHRSAVNTVHDVNARFGVGPTDRVLAVSALDFDLSVYDIFGMLTAGAALVLLGDDERRDARRWRELADRHGVTVWNSTPTLLEMLLVAAGDGGMPRDLRVALVSGDWVGVDLKARMDALGSTCRLVALGGATEAAIWSNAFEVGHVPARWTSIPYGFPLRNQCFRVVDAHRRDCPDRVVGELWIGGLGLATGYRGDPARTAESFVTDAGRRWYRTGDLGRYWPDGTLEFLGRMDQQVKIGGHRVKLGEVEAALTEHPAVRDAVAVATGDRGRRRLAAFVVPKDPRTGSADCLASLPAFLAERLPAHSVPDRLGILDEVPLTSHGKVDRTAVLAGADALPDGRGEPARGAVEEAVAGIWSELLGVPVRRNHNFFALGGDSLLATGLVGRLRAQGFGGAGLGDLFDAPVLADFAARITPSSPGPPGLPGQPGEPRPTSGAVVVLPDPEHRHEPFPATELQRAYWVGRSDQFWLGGVGSHYYCEYDETDLDLPRLEEAWNRLIARHEMLRAVFDEHGDQRVLPTVDRFRISVQTADDDADGALAALRDRMSHQVLDPSRWPLFDVRAVRYGANQTRIGISLDYLLVDGLSMMILFTELDRLYADLDADLPSTGVSFRDYVGQVAPDPEATARAERYWRRRIPELPPAPQLPVARDPAVLGRPRFVRRESWLPPRKWDALRAGARRHGVTPSTLLLACFAEVLGAWSARADLTVCLTVFDRRDVHPDINHILGDFTSLLLVAHRPESGEAWSSRVRRLQEQV